VYAYLWVAFVSADEALLFLDAFCNDSFWVIPYRGRGGFVPCDFWFVAALDSPAKYAFLVTVGYGWCHLDASVALDAVELLFVAWAVVC